MSASAFTLSPEDIKLINPNTRTCPSLSKPSDAELTKKIYRGFDLYSDEKYEAGILGTSSLAMFHMGKDSELFRTCAQLRNGGMLDGVTWMLCARALVSLLEPTMIHHFDHPMGATYGEGRRWRMLATSQRSQTRSPTVCPRYWVAEREIGVNVRSKGWERELAAGWRDITGATKRTNGHRRCDSHGSDVGR